MDLSLTRYGMTVMRRAAILVCDSPPPFPSCSTAGSASTSSRPCGWLTLCRLGPLQQVHGRCSSNRLLRCPDVHVCDFVLNLNPDCVVEPPVHHSSLSFTTTINGSMQIMNKHLGTAKQIVFRTSGRDRCELVPELLFYSYSLVPPTVSSVFSCITKFYVPSLL